MTSLIILSVYSLLATLALLWLRRRSPAEQLGGRILSELEAASEVSEEKRFELMAKVASLYHETVPWFERSLSTVGVFAFLGMAVASAVQTVSANSAAARADQLRAELEVLQQEAAQAEAILDRVARGILTLGWSGEDLDEASREVLRHRLRTLEAASPSADGNRERYLIALALGDFRGAIGVLEADRELLGSTSPGDLVTLAEYYYLTGAEERARQLTQRAGEKASDLPRPVRVRLITLEAALSGLGEEHTIRLAALLRLSKPAAQQILRSRVRRLVQARENMGTE